MMDDILVEYNGELLPETMAGRLEPLCREAHDIQQYLNAPYSGEINVLLDRLSTLNVYMARSGEMLAEAVFSVSKTQANVLSVMMFLQYCTL